MQTITPDLAAILKARLQAGSDGFRARVEIDRVSPGVGPFVNASSAEGKVWLVSYAGGTLGGTPTGWQAPGFDDSAWAVPVTVGPFAPVVTAVPPAEMVAPAEAVSDLYVSDLTWLARIPFTLGSIPETANLYVSHDDGASFYINGTLVYSATGEGTHPDNTVARNVTAAPFVVGENVLAVSVHNSTFASTFNPNPTWVEYRLLTDVDPVLATEVYRPKRVSLDKSLQMVADQATIEFENEDLPLGWGPGSYLATNSRVRIYQWFGDEANEVRTFTGVLDSIVDSRDPLATVASCRDMMAILLDQTFGATAPQATDEPGNVRTEANGVYLAREVSYIVADILDRAGWPAADRAITPTSYTLDEYVIPDGTSWAEAIIGDAVLTGLVGYQAWADEAGVFHFAPTFMAGALTEPGEPVYTFRSGEDITTLQHETDQYDMRTRVKVRGPLTTQTLTDTWRQLWRTSKFSKPVGIWYDPADAGCIRVLDRGTKRLYRMRQSDRKVLSSKNLGAVITYPLGVSGDPSDATIYWVLNGPWLWGSGSTSQIVKVRKSDHHVLARYNLDTDHWSSIKVSGAYIYVANLTDDRVYRRSKSTGAAVDSFRHTYSSVAQSNPSGVMIDGTTISVFWSNGGTTARFLQCAESAPGTVTKRVKTAGTVLHGGEMDRTTHTECWGGSDSLGLVAKFTLIDVANVTTEVYAEVVDTELEDELGAYAQSEPRTHDTHPGDGAHAFEVRRDTLDVTVVASLAQATETAMRRLDKLSQRRRVLDAGIIGNPALQKTDLVRVEDPVSGLAEDWFIDTYRSEMAADSTYLGTLALIPASPADDTPIDEGDSTE